MKKLKTLYKLSRDRLFQNDFYCIYCGVMDFDKYFIRDHIKNYHDESGREIKMFRCNKCSHTVMKNEIIKHVCHEH